MKRRYTWKTGIGEALLIIVALIFVSPLLILVNEAFKAPGDAASPLGLPSNPTFDNFVEAWQTGHLANAFVNSTIVVVLSLAVLISTSSLAAYAISRIGSRLTKTVYVLFLIGLLLPFQLATIPLYQGMRAAGLLGTVWGLVFFYTAIMMPFSVFLYVVFLSALDKEYEEAAAIDGAGSLRTFFSVVFPLMRAITGTIVILNTISIWNDFFTPQLYLSGSGTETVTVALYGWVGQYGSQWSLIFSGLILATIPLLVLFFILQRSVIKGFAGGLKG